MATEPVILDTKIHDLLKRSGYAFLLIKNVHFNDEKRISSITVKAEKSIPGAMLHSCTGIDDPMITTFIHRLELDCKIFLESVEELFLHVK